MAPSQATAVADFLHQLVPPTRIRQQAVALGFVQRQNGFDPVPFVAALLFFLPPRGTLSRAAIWRAYTHRARQRLSRSAFYDRFNDGLERLLSSLVDSIQRRALDRHVVFTGVLAGFRDVIVADATTVALRPALRDVWPASNDGQAALKVHTRVRATTGELLFSKLTSALDHDSRFFGSRWRDAGKLFILDQAYCSAARWYRIARVGGFFVTRLPASFKPTIERSLRRHRGRARPVAGRKLREVLGELERKVLDVECLFRVRIHRYGKKRGRYIQYPLRVVAVLNEESGQYHVYVTNIPGSRLAAENIWDIYRLRWEVELSYRGLKSESGLSELSSADPVVVKTLVKAALLRSAVSLQARVAATTKLPKRRWIGLLMWHKIWNESLTELLPVVAEVPGARLGFGWRELALRAACPDRKRRPTRHRLLHSDPRTAYI